MLSGVREISGIDRVLDFLERRFFDRSRLIRSSAVLCRALRITDRAYIVHDGVIFRSGTPASLAADEEVRGIYLGDAFRLD